MLICPTCSSKEIVKNGSIHTGKQKYKCKKCNRQFVENPRQKPISNFTKEKIMGCLIERISLAGIARLFGVSKRWVQYMVNDFYKSIKLEINEKFLLKSKAHKFGIVVECDEMWSFCGNKNNKLYVWLAMDKLTRQIIGIHVGKRDISGARALFNSLPKMYQERALFYTDFWKPYESALPQNRHCAVGKETGKTNHIERFNNTVRQRLARFARDTLSFSKKELNHKASLYHFINHYNEIIFNGN